jgi:uncharacterized protein
MPGLFVDTSGWGNLFDANQSYHVLATKLYRTARAQSHRIITTNYVMSELVVLLSSPLRIPRATSIALVQSLKASAYVEIMHIDLETDQQAWELLASRADKEWSLVDCVSFVVMQRLHITEALTTDHHFDQAGFLRLLK